MQKILRIFFHHFYHGLAWTYDFVAALVSVGRWQPWGFAVLPHIRGPRVLEIGFGPGHLQVELNRSGFHAFGLDESRQMTRQARANLTRSGFPVALSRGYAQFLPFVDGSLDSVAATFPSEYISDSLTLAEIRRVLKPSGRLVLVPVAWIWGKSLTDRCAKWLFRITGQSWELTDAFAGRFKSRFTEAGFRVEIIHAEIRHSTVLIIVATVNNRAQ
jgi:ubiquinone/menaquinone biosynthesis C-methylase UbiE